MTVWVLGINQQAPVSIRESMAIPKERIISHIKTALMSIDVLEMVYLTTCNRTEVYLHTADDVVFDHALLAALGLASDHFSNYGYRYKDEEAVQHIMKVASGLDSMVVGEPQVLGQLKDAYRMAEQAGGVTSFFNGLFSNVFASSKHIRTSTDIGKCPVSIAYMLVKMMKAKCLALAERRVVLIGAGSTTELVATHLKQCGVTDITVVGRKAGSVAALAQSLGGRYVLMEDMMAVLQEADIVITATSSSQPLLTQAAVSQLMKQRPDRPLFMADLAVPRDIDSEVAELEQVTLYDMDKLQSFVADNQLVRGSAKKQAEAMIELHAQNFFRQLKMISSNDVIQRFRQQALSISTEVAKEYVKQLDQKGNAAVVVESMARELTNKLLHKPTILLKALLQVEDEALLDTIEKIVD